MVGSVYDSQGWTWTICVWVQVLCMPRGAGPERFHFGGQTGLNTLMVNGKATYYWLCQYCGFKLGGKSFQVRKARIHLSGNNSLRNGLIAQVCTKAPPSIKEQFYEREIENTSKLNQEAASHKRSAELMASSPQLTSPAAAAAARKKRKQSTLPFCLTTCDEEVDNVWGKAFFGLNIAANKISHPLFREAIDATVQSTKS